MRKEILKIVEKIIKVTSKKWNNKKIRIILQYTKNGYPPISFSQSYKVKTNFTRVEYLDIKSKD